MAIFDGSEWLRKGGPTDSPLQLGKAQSIFHVLCVHCLKLLVLFFLLIVHHCTIILHLYNVFVERPGIVLGLNEVEKSPALSKDATHG